jgi:FixJ family two-component response regulator
MSGYADDPAARSRILDNDVTFLSKPFTTEALARALRRALAVTRPRPS